MSKELIQSHVQELYGKYRKEGGFGFYDVDRLCARNVNVNEKIYQEETLTEMYFIVYDQEISQQKLERNYLGRKRMGIYERCGLQLQYGIPKECVVSGQDPFITFSKRYRVNGYMYRLYWKEKNIDRAKINIIQKIEETVLSKPTLVRSNSCLNLK
jgi:hypothetical protein